MVGGFQEPAKATELKASGARMELYISTDYIILPQNMVDVLFLHL